MNDNGGFTRSYRRKWDNPVFRNKQEAAVWAWMCDIAQYQDHTLPTKFGPIALKQGELLMAERTLADDFGLHRNTLRGLLNRMVDAGMITLIRDRIPARAGTIVHVTNYAEYQGFNGVEYDAKDRKTDTTETEAGPQKDHKRTENNTVKESNKNPLSNPPSNVHILPTAAPEVAAGNEVVFKGKSFCLNRRDFDRHKANYYAIPDFMAAVKSCDEQLVGKKNPYAALLAKLNGMHQCALRIAAERAAAKAAPVRRSHNPNYLKTMSARGA